MLAVDADTCLVEEALPDLFSTKELQGVVMSRWRDLTPAKAARLRREAEKRRSEQRKRWWALAVVVLIIVLMFLGLGMLESRLGRTEAHADGGVGKNVVGGSGRGHSDQE